MEHNIIAAVIIAFGLCAAALILFGRYYFIIRMNDVTVLKADRGRVNWSE
jgi:hypothetical protein